MVDYLSFWINDYTWNIDWKNEKACDFTKGELQDLAENLLDFIEESGMKPPSPYNVPHHDSLYHWEEE